MNLPVSSEPAWLPRTSVGRAAIYNRYLKTIGGGERSSIEFARALEDLGYEITLITDPGSNTSVEKLASVFGITPRTRWSLVEVESSSLNRYCLNTRQDVFVNHTYSSYIPSAAPIGIYLLMFPHQISDEQLKAMASYKAIFCISPFVELYLKMRWGNEFPLVVFPPPISQQHFQNNYSLTKKEKLILNVGRFNVDGHSKCQKEAIEAFIWLKEMGVLDPEWRMIVAGHLNEGELNREYFEYCSALSPEDVTVIKNASFNDLCKYYSRAAVLFQFTGFGLDFGVIPERCEHLGLVAMDAMCYGTIPVVYERSGAALITDWGDSMYSFTNRLELAKIMSWITADFGTSSYLSHMRRCRAEAQKYCYANFCAKLEGVLAK